MAGALSMAGSLVDSTFSPSPCPCLCVDSLSLSNANFRSNGRNLRGRKQLKKTAPLGLSTSFLDTWDDWRLSGRVLSQIVRGYSRKHQKIRQMVIVDELGGQYEDSFNDVELQIVNYFTYKAVRTVLYQLYEMNPPQYTWLYNFVATNKPADAKQFIRTLGKEKQDLAERVMVTRLHLYGKWVKKCDHAKIYQEISDQNLELMRERLMETVVWPSDDTNIETIG